MNADLKRIREAGIDDTASPAKKRALSLSTPPLQDQSEDDKMEDWMRVVEVSETDPSSTYRVILVILVSRIPLHSLFQGIIKQFANCHSLGEEERSHFQANARV